MPEVDDYVTNNDWITPGSPVLVYSVGGVGVANPRTTTINKVSTKTFSVAAEHEPRFDLIRHTASINGTWGSHRHVVPLDSDTARKVLAAEARRRQYIAARNAFERWREHSTRENRLAAIATLEAIEEET